MTTVMAESRSTSISPCVRSLPPTTVSSSSRFLTDREIARIVNRYIGVSGGYLGDFSYRTHADFYREYCDMDINPYAYEGTIRERFIAGL